MSSKNVQTARRSVEAFIAGDWEAVAEAAHPDLEWIETPGLGPDPGVYRGIDGMRSATTSWLDRWTDYELSLDEVREAGDDVVLLLTERGRGEGSGAAVQRELGQLMTFREGKIASARLYGSWSQALEAAGLSE